MIRMYSSLTAPRGSKWGAPSAWNSSRSHPTPTPTVIRPWESTSIVASAFAVTTGFRCGTIMTLETRRRVRVLPAMKAMSESCSSASPWPGKAPVTVYGYFELMATGKTTWSAIITELKPSASARCTSVSSASGDAVSPRVGREKPYRMDWSFRSARRVLPAILSQGGHDLPCPASHEGARIRHEARDHELPGAGCHRAGDLGDAILRRAGEGEAVGEEIGQAPA